MDRGAESYRSYLNGDDDGLRQLIEAYRTPLQLFLQTFVRDAALAEDLTQETFLRLACRRPRFDGRCAFKTWLYQIGRNVAVDCLRRQKKEIPTEDAVLGTAADDTEALELQYLREETRRSLHRAMEQLKPDYRQILWLRFFEELPMKDCARILKKSTHAAEMTLSRAKSALRTELEKEGLFDEIE